MNKRTRTQYHKFISDHEYQQIIEFAEFQNPGIRLAVFFMAKLGLRVSEAVSVNESEIDLDNCMLTKYITKQKKIVQRVIPNSMMELIRDHLRKFRREVSESEGFLCFIRHNNQYKDNLHVSRNSISWFFCRFRDYYGYDESYFIRKNGSRLTRFSSHVLRSYWISKFVEKTGNVRLAQLEIGHANSATTWQYVRFADRTKKVADVVNELF